MADLDDFFAKRDKKKSKAKPKFVTAEDLAKNLEDNIKKEAAIKAATKKPEVVGSEVSGSEPEAGVATVSNDVDGGNENNTKVVEQEPEEEWRDFEQEQRKDYSGLKISQLSITDNRVQTRKNTKEGESYNDGNYNNDSNATSKGGQVPWKKLIPAEEVTQIPVEIEKPSKVYISPALRQSQGLNAGMGPRPTRNRTAPDITNAEFFPSLSAARPEEQRKKKNEPAFEEVRHGGRLQRVQESVAAPTAATNRFQSLDDETD